MSELSRKMAEWYNSRQVLEYDDVFELLKSNDSKKEVGGESSYFEDNCYVSSVQV